MIEMARVELEHDFIADLGGSPIESEVMHPDGLEAQRVALLFVELISGWQLNALPVSPLFGDLAIAVDHAWPVGGP